MQTISVSSASRFNPGQVVMTAGIHDLVQSGQLNPGPILERHLKGDWGDLSEEDSQQNEAALSSGEARLFSAYQVDPNTKVWIITEWDRSVTTLLLPDEY